jgi:hypothetical protein
VDDLDNSLMAISVAPLASLVEPDARVPVGAIAEQWDLPGSDRAALTDYGLPRGPLLVPSPQAVTAPILSPNVAGERERRLVSADQQLYQLGVYGADFDSDLTIRVGAVAGSGRVLGVRARPMTVTDLHPQLRAYHVGLYHPAVCYFNVSVAAFVEIAWRWRAAVEAIRTQVDSLVDDSYELHAELEQAGSAFLNSMALIDPTLTDDLLESIWVETMTDDL